MTDTRNDRDRTEMPAGSLVLKSREYGKKLLVCFMVVSLGFAGWYFHREFSQPAEGTVRVLTPEAYLSDPGSPPVSVRHQKEYFAIVLPDTYQDKERETNLVKGTTLRGQAFFSDPTGSLRKVAVTIDERPGLAPRDLSSYAYRHAHPEIYRERKLTYQGQDIDKKEKWDTVYEIVAYLPRDNRFVASIALVSAFETPDELIGDFSAIVDSFEWVQSKRQPL